MSKKYLSLEEAARLLSVAPDELIRLRERGEIRGFADRGTWKFKQEDVESLVRRRQADSNPEVPLFDKEGLDDSGHDQPLMQNLKSQTDSDSDVKLVGGSNFDIDFDSDSDVKLVGLGQSFAGDLNVGTDPDMPILPPDSDSDVKLVRPDSDSDVKLPADDSDSDVKLVDGQPAPADEDTLGTESDLPLVADSQKKSDSDVKLMADEPVADVTLIGFEAPEALDLDAGSEGLKDESGISLSSSSSTVLGSESGINLEGPSDSGIALNEDEDEEGITLALDADSGISIDPGDSGISLESVGESGISLEGPTPGGTIPMMNAMEGDNLPETQFEIPVLENDDNSGYELQTSDDTGVLDVESTGVEDAVFDLGDDDADAAATFEDEMDLEADAFDDEEELDVFDADEEAFAQGDSESGFAGSGVGRMPMVESEWGTGLFVMLTVSSLALLLSGVVMIDLVKNTANSARPNPVSGKVLDMLGGMYNKG